MHGKGWKKIASLIKTRTVVQIRTHAQKYFQKLAKAKQNGFEGEILMDGRSTFTATTKKVRPAVLQTRAGSARTATAYREQQRGTKRKPDSSRQYDDDSSTPEADEDDCGEDFQTESFVRSQKPASSLKIDSGAVKRVGNPLGSPSPTSITDAWYGIHILQRRFNSVAYSCRLYAQLEHFHGLSIRFLLREPV
jgi:hypothetical protein